jgi:DUF971 family protein
MADTDKSAKHAPWPTEIRLSPDKRLVTVAFEDGVRFELSAEYLRVMSPSAEVRGHAAHERKTVAGKKNVRIASIEPMGRYAVKFGFDDGHATGIYAWAYLHELGATVADKWRAYMAELQAKGLKRE